MAKMSLGGYTFPQNPSKAPIIAAKKSASSLETYSNVGYFSWGTFIAGIEFDLTWPWVRTSTWASLDALLQADSTVVFNPQDGSGHTYNCEILSLDGDPHVGLNIAPNTYRVNVKMKLLILSKV